MVKSGIKSLFTAAKNVATGTDQSVPQAISDKRQSICNECPYRLELTNQCKECGCFLSLKTKLRQEKCPLEKWLEYTEDK